MSDVFKFFFFNYEVVFLGIVVIIKKNLFRVFIKFSYL